MVSTAGMGYHLGMERKTLGSMIAALRKEKGMTQAELAAVMGVTDKAVSKWERDLGWPDAASLGRLADALGVSVDELLRCHKAEKGRRDIILLILRSVSLAMGVAAVVFSFLGRLEASEAVQLLGIGLLCLALQPFMDGRA